MGIPSYFTQIIKKYPQILETFIKEKFNIDNLYFDSNSIIYDIVNNMPFNNNTIEYENKTIQKVFEKIIYYVDLINPQKSIFITFDGIAPIAKLEQQRQRRYKTWYINEVKKELQIEDSKNKWNTSNITPGTNFMTKLNNELHKLLNNYYKSKDINLYFSGSDEVGEGEHKIFDLIRKNAYPHNIQSTVIYGLDADLIMLCLNHLHLCKQLYLFRDTPVYISNINNELNKDLNYLLNINELGQNLFNYHNIDLATSFDLHDLLSDYNFICFMLGNDFLPHFPSLNLRTYGMDNILNAYYETCIKEQRLLTTEKKINWKNFRHFIEFLANNEYNFIKSEYKLRTKLSYKKFPINNNNDKFKLFMETPIKDRTIEESININQNGWENRYYYYLFDLQCHDNTRIKQICINYLEGLEWNFKYYNFGMINNTWKYNYNYPPLLTDLYKYIPYFNIEFIQNEITDIPPLLQLVYVLPKGSHSILPTKTQKLLQKYDYLYPNIVDFDWAFCKYFWECHARLPKINLNKLKELII